MSSGRSRSLELVLSLAFVAGIAAPSVEQFRHGAGASDLRVEFRPLAAQPELSFALEQLASYPSGFDDWYGDHFGYRAQLIRAHNRFKLNVLDTSPTRRLVFGPGNWVFAAWDDTIPFSMGLHPLERWELDAWRQLLELRTEQLAQLGASYRYVLVPNKDHLYADHLPARLRRVGPTRREQFCADSEGDEHVLDLWPALTAARDEDGPAADDALFYRLGDHWTDRGALVAAQAIISSLAEEHPQLNPLRREDFERIRIDSPGDTWARRLYMDDLLQQEVRLLSGKMYSSATDEERNGVRISRHRRNDLPGGLKALVFHDSFGEQIRRFLAESFGELVAVWSGDYDAAIVAEERPDIVIELYIERTLATRSARLKGPEAEGLLRARFADLEVSREVLRPADELDAFDMQGAPEFKPDAGGGLIVTTASRGDLIVLPEADWGEGSRILRLVIEPPEPTILQVAYQTRGDLTYDLSRSLNLNLTAGRNELFIDLSIPEIAGRLLMRPGLVRGRYVLHEFELRVEHNR